ncbi:MAG: alpha/beta fold hydrolase [Caldilineales bacterium]|nr:alpha/beta fold hydrolase [Caldilineales bacterium]MDW8319208.1 alpha/beta fold hydrolase [Anaerolineae bacterium]
MNLAHAFAGPDHRTFLWQGGEAAALLIHGFPGTPNEVRPLAETLHCAGWTVQGLLLPGFGPEIETLARRRHQEWVAAVVEALADLQRRHRPTLLVGFSMGAAVSMAAAGRRRPDGLALLAPFWKVGGLAAAIFPVVRRVFPAIQPFRLFKVDFNNPEVRKGIDNFLPGLDLDDPAVQQAVREFTVPVTIVEEVRRIGQLAGQTAPRLRLPTLVVQGAADPVVRPPWTQELIEQMPGPVWYREVPTGHNLLEPESPAWPAVQSSVLEFAASLRQLPVLAAPVVPEPTPASLPPA